MGVVVVFGVIKVVGVVVTLGVVVTVGVTIDAVSYTHLTLPTKRIV